MITKIGYTPQKQNYNKPNQKKEVSFGTDVSSVRKFLKRQLMDYITPALSNRLDELAKDGNNRVLKVKFNVVKKQYSYGDTESGYYNAGELALWSTKAKNPKSCISIHDKDIRNGDYYYRSFIEKLEAWLDPKKLEKAEERGFFL